MLLENLTNTKRGFVSVPMDWPKSHVVDGQRKIKNTPMCSKTIKECNYFVYTLTVFVKTFQTFL